MGSAVISLSKFCSCTVKPGYLELDEIKNKISENSRYQGKNTLKDK
jgi:hypothetical protein